MLSTKSVPKKVREILLCLTITATSRVLVALRGVKIDCWRLMEESLVSKEGQ